METLAGWVAPVATMIAAMMTAANLGARVTGWGFVIFTAGSLAWSLLGFATGQTNLLATNVFLTFVNIVGIWRWLGRQRAYEDGGKSAEAASRRSRHPDLFTATGISGMPVVTADGRAVGKAVEALVACETGHVSYVVVASDGVGGIAETLRAVARADIRFACEKLELVCALDRFEALPSLKEGDWPAAPVAVERKLIR
ncbi:photosystem reaction center subunit H [Novosphingobium guangzhouense]|uniref:Photosystem reaction center subunit H n=2 Tax=Sphingomonadaceae TaxID=41297 RepID=A0A2K2FV69_9SPHN|nr:photosystem reaction center subunit H [Novosphingobium guangzhouense]